MFQKQTFGSNTTGFGAFNSAATTSSPFGSFKPPTAGSTFGAAPAFGASTSTQPATGGGLFGSSNTSTGLFGSTPAAAPAPAFGTSNSFSFGGNTSGGLFNNANTPASGGLFGNNSFAKPAGFGFGSTTTTGTTGGGLFGSTPSTSTGLFGQQTNTLGGGGLFSTGSTFGQQSATGTARAKYNPVVGTDVVVKSGNSQTINIKHHCITCMKEYEGKSLEELRLEDYTAGRKGASGGGMFGGFQQPAENKPLFGGSTFGQPATTSAPSLFGSSLGSTGGFGQTSECTINIYNYTPQSKPTPKQYGLLFGSDGKTDDRRNDLLDAAKRAIDTRNRHDEENTGEKGRDVSVNNNVSLSNDVLKHKRKDFIVESEERDDLDYTCPLYSVSNSNKDTPVFKFSTDSDPHEKWKTTVFFSKEPLWPINRNKTKVSVNNNKYNLYGRTGNLCGSVRRLNSENPTSKFVPTELRAQFASSAVQNTHFEPIVPEKTIHSKPSNVLYHYVLPQRQSVYYFNHVLNPQIYPVQQPHLNVIPTHTVIQPQIPQVPTEPQPLLPVHTTIHPQSLIPVHTVIHPQPISTHTVIYPQQLIPIQPITLQHQNLTYNLPNEIYTQQQNQFIPIYNLTPHQSVPNLIPQTLPNGDKNEIKPNSDEKKHIRINIHNNFSQGKDGNNNALPQNLNAQHETYVIQDATINIYNYPNVETTNEPAPLVLKKDKITGLEPFWNWTSDDAPKLRNKNPWPFGVKKVLDKATNTDDDETVELSESNSDQNTAYKFSEPVVVSTAAFQFDFNSSQLSSSSTTKTNSNASVSVYDPGPSTSTVQVESNIYGPSNSSAKPSIFKSTFKHGANSAFSKPAKSVIGPSASNSIFESPLSQANIFCSPPKFTVPPGAFFGPTAPSTSQSVSEPGFFKCKQSQCASCGCNLHTLIAQPESQTTVEQGSQSAFTTTAPIPSANPGIFLPESTPGSGIFGPIGGPVLATSKMIPAPQPTDFGSIAAIKSSIFGPDTLDIQKAMSSCSLNPGSTAGQSSLALNPSSQTLTSTSDSGTSTARPTVVESRPLYGKFSTEPVVTFTASGSVDSQTSTLDSAVSNLRIHDLGIENPTALNNPDNLSSQASISKFMSILKLPMADLYAMSRAKAMSKAQTQNTTTLTNSGISNVSIPPSNLNPISKPDASPSLSSPQVPSTQSSISIIKLPMSGPSNIPKTEVRPNSHVVTNSISISKIPMTVSDNSVSEASDTSTSQPSSPNSVVERPVAGPARGSNSNAVKRPSRPPAARSKSPSECSCTTSSSSCECERDSNDSNTGSPSASDVDIAN